jgi:predicted helicase
VTNGGFIDSNTADGMRKTLAEEFSAIHVFNLRGNQRTAGEQSRKEGGKVFDAGSRATVAITVLVKNPRHVGPAAIRYADIGEYLSREEKLRSIGEARGFAGLTGVVELAPNEQADWLSQRRDDFSGFVPVDGVGGIFALNSLGVGTNRDAWVFNASRVSAR